jgi:predicted ester cyclase
MYRYARLIVFVSFYVLLMSNLLVHAQTNNAQRNKKLVQDALAQISAGKPDAVSALFADPLKMNQGGTELVATRPKDILGFQEALQAAIPDLKLAADVIIAQNDDVAAFVTTSGTFSKPFSFAPFGPNPIPPTNKAIQWSEIDVFHFNSDGKATQVWSVSDPTVMLIQMGIMPAQPQDSNPLKVKDLTDPVGFKALSSTEQAATFTTGMERRNLALLEKQAQEPIGTNSEADYIKPYISRADAPNPEEVNPGADPIGAVFSAAMPDLKAKIVAEVAEGDWTGGAAIYTGTFTGKAQLGDMTLKPTGKTISWPIAVIQRRNAEGKVVEEWAQLDPSALLQGLGLASSPDATPAK